MMGATAEYPATSGIFHSVNIILGFSLIDCSLCVGAVLERVCFVDPIRR